MTQEEAMELWDKVVKYAPSEVRIYEFAKLVAAHEREACAKLCDELPAPNFYSASDKGMWDIASMECAAAIRARGEQA